MVPSNWKIIHLKDVLSTPVKNGFSPNAVEYNTGYFVLGLGALTDEKLNTQAIKKVELSDNVNKSQINSGDFLVSRSNTPDKVGRSVLFRGEIKNCSYPDLMMKFRVNGELANPDFIEAALQSSITRQYFKSCAAGSSSSMVKITKSVVEKTPLKLPPLAEQQKIANILSTWDKAISTTEKLIATSEQQKKSLMQQLLTGKKRLLNPETGKAFEAEWGKQLLSQICGITKGKQLNRSTLSDTGSYPVINGGITPSGYTENFNVAGNTITISEGGNSCGYVGFQVYPFWCGGHCYHLLNSSINNEYLYQYLKGIERILMSLRVGSGLPNIQKKAIENVQILVPSIYEQQKIASVLSSADKGIELLQAKLAHFKQEKKALMQQLLTGKRRVKIKRKEEVA